MKNSATCAPESWHFEYVLRLGDNALILGQRISEWCGHSPFVEEDVAMANTALDHIGRARMLLTHAGNLQANKQTEDDLAYSRNEREFKNFLLCELPIGDFAFTIVRQVLLDTYHFHLYDALQKSSDETLAAIATKVVKESTYHLRHSSEWLIRLGDGTEESQRRAQLALDNQWRFTSEFFLADEVDDVAHETGVGVDVSLLEKLWRDNVDDILSAACLLRPEDAPLRASGRMGLHTEHMGFLLAEMQSVQRAYPGLNW
jgi:ring-1,2-phenylacetyl-CoA epoxidase subunit PaaC